jgi:hypothetical protein
MEHEERAELTEEKFGVNKKLEGLRIFLRSLVGLRTFWELSSTRGKECDVDDRSESVQKETERDVEEERGGECERSELPSS